MDNRFGKPRSKEEREAERDKFLAKEKLSLKTIQKRKGLMRLMLKYKTYQESELEEEFGDNEEEMEDDNEEDMEDESKMSNEEVETKFEAFIKSHSNESLDVFLADFVIDFHVNMNRKKNHPPKWEPPSMGYFMNLIRNDIHCK